MSIVSQFMAENVPVHSGRLVRCFIVSIYSSGGGGIRKPLETLNPSTIQTSAVRKCLLGCVKCRIVDKLPFVCTCQLQNLDNLIGDNTLSIQTKIINSTFKAQHRQRHLQSFCFFISASSCGIFDPLAF